MISNRDERSFTNHPWCHPHSDCLDYSLVTGLNSPHSLRQACGLRFMRLTPACAARLLCNISPPVLREVFRSIIIGILPASNGRKQGSKHQLGTVCIPYAGIPLWGCGVELLSPVIE
ncbi:hypothetical protein D3C77_314150 [compost metagenome]